ncbi:MAG: ferritin-like domain-containing protein [Alphaproteobacteria bacterium]|nr:ferritin-like domain-containing protein [Alphaproteobacteria bacterium]
MSIGTEDHKNLFCRMLLDTFNPYKPAVIQWPVLSEEAFKRLTTLPFWNIAVHTEERASVRVKALAEQTLDPLLKEAISLDAFEEDRHKHVLKYMTDFYGIKIAPYVFEKPKNAEWAFMLTGYGECFESFFAFGLFALARKSGFFPLPLIEVFEPVVQEEGRHILFFVNWVAYVQANLPFWKKPWFFFKCMAAIIYAVWTRVKTVTGTKTGNFTAQGANALSIKTSALDFLNLCFSENDRRMKIYDERLLRPKLVPNLMNIVRWFLEKRKK